MAAAERVIVREQRRSAASAATITAAIREYFADSEVPEPAYARELRKGDRRAGGSRWPDTAQLRLAMRVRGGVGGDSGYRTADAAHSDERRPLRCPDLSQELQDLDVDMANAVGPVRLARGPAWTEPGGRQ
jgi:hypothetical protein